MRSTGGDGLTITGDHGAYGPIWRVSIATGMRRGELLGLRWADIDWHSKVLHIRQTEHRLVTGPAWHDHDLVFCSEVGTPIQPSNLRRDYQRLIELAGVPCITIHDQRHTVASWAIAAGVDPKTAAERLGQHVSMTLSRYTHTSPKQHRDAAVALDDIRAGEEKQDTREAR